MTPPIGKPAGPAHSWLGPRGELLVVMQLVLVTVFIFAPQQNAWVSDLLAPTAPFRTAALWLLEAVAGLMAVAGFVQIRRFLTPLPYPVAHSELVTTGIYGVIRHPLYACQLIAGLGWALYTFSALHLALLVLAFAFFDYKASMEERWLTERHACYSAYARRTCKLIPWLY